MEKNPQNDLVYPGERVDDLQNGLYVIQNPEKFCFGMTSNPPYMIGQHGLQNPYMAKAIARHEILCTLEDVVSQAAAVLKDRGRFYMVHRPFRLAEIFQVLMKYKLEPKRMQLVYPYIDREPNMVLIEARKGGNSRITVERPLIVYEKPGVYTSDILEIYGRV